MGVSGGTDSLADLEALVALVDAVGAGAGVLGFFESADFFTRVRSPYVVMLYNSLIWVEPWPSRANEEHQHQHNYCARNNWHANAGLAKAGLGDDRLV